jgi:hypothetical protein
MMLGLAIEVSNLGFENSFILGLVFSIFYILFFIAPFYIYKRHVNQLHSLVIKKIKELV